MELRHPQNKRTKCFSSVPAQVYRVFEEEDARLTRLGDSISSVLRKELGSRITGRTNLMVRQTFENQQEAAGIWMGFWSDFWDGMAVGDGFPYSGIILMCFLKQRIIQITLWTHDFCTSCCNDQVFVRHFV